MKWTVFLYEAFEEELLGLADEVQDEIAAYAALLERFGPQLGRPYVDTLENSKHSNMKELRFNAANGVWRVAFAFDHQRQAILLVAGDKAGVSQSRFYKRLIKTADARFSEWINREKEG